MELNKMLILFSLVLLLSCQKSDPATQAKSASSDESLRDLVQQKMAIGKLLDTLNATAARADHEAYFNCYAEGATFLGTDAGEHWNKEAFRTWSKPYFDRGKAWSFQSIDRHVYFDQHPDIAWFDELLNTQMKICRGSGVVVRQNGEWKIKQYVLSITFPNDFINEAIKIKSATEDSLIQVLLEKHSEEPKK